jgi:hypothetical protein
MLTAPANAEPVRSEVLASDTTKVTVYSDEFADRYEYTGPSVAVLARDRTEGMVMVARKRAGGVSTPIYVTGFVMYPRDWRHYSTAVLRGGAALDFEKTGSDVNCYRSSCTLTESFRFQITPEQIAAHAVDGKISIQVRAQSTDTLMIHIPVNHFTAVEEVSRT